MVGSTEMFQEAGGEMGVFPRLFFHRLGAPGGSAVWGGWDGTMRAVPAELLGPSASSTELSIIFKSSPENTPQESPHPGQENLAKRPQIPYFSPISLHPALSMVAGKVTRGVPDEPGWWRCRPRVRCPASIHLPGAPAA